MTSEGRELTIKSLLEEKKYADLLLFIEKEYTIANVEKVTIEFVIDTDTFKHFVGRDPVDNEFDDFVRLVRKGCDAQLDWDMIYSLAATDFINDINSLEQPGLCSYCEFIVDAVTNQCTNPNCPESQLP